MKKDFLLRVKLLSLSIMLSTVLFAQKTDTACKVLLKEISGSYNGKCANGLADGDGTAVGEDSYTGSFKNGFPDGKGTYKFKNGNTYIGYWKNGLKDGKGEFKYTINGQTTILKGYWLNGDYAGTEKPMEDYRVTNKIGVEYFSIIKKGNSKDKIEISFETAYIKYLPIDLSIKCSNGNVTQNYRTMVIQDYSIPLNCAIQFTLSKGAVRKLCSFTFDILKPGYYTVLLSSE